MAKIKFTTIEEAFDFASFGNEESAAVISRSTGEVFYQSEDAEIDEIPKKTETDDDYVWLPDKYELDLGTRLVSRFAKECIPEHHAAIESIFSRRGAYGKFKNYLANRGLLERWYEFENGETKKALLRWCQENGIEVEEE